MKPQIPWPLQAPIGFPIKIQPKALWDVYLSRSDPWPCPDLDGRLHDVEGICFLKEKNSEKTNSPVIFEDSRVLYPHVGVCNVSWLQISCGV